MLSLVTPADLARLPCPLSPRQRACLRLAAMGCRNRAIGQVLHLSEHTVKGHFTVAYNKLGARNRTEAVLLALQRGELRLEDIPA